MSRSLRTDPYPLRAARRDRGIVPIRVTAARPGFHHPASPTDIREVLVALGPVATYGVRSVELRQSVDPAHRDLYGMYRYPGRIVLFEQPISWISPVPLREFMLWHVLPHEIGHHVLQHRSGKRTVPRRRGRDHERYADLFAERARSLPRLLGAP